MTTYDTPPQFFNAWAEVRTSSVDWFNSTLGTDLAITRNSDTSYTFWTKQYVFNDITGWFYVQHAIGDSFTYVGQYPPIAQQGPTPPPNGVYPTVMLSVSTDMIGAAPTEDPTFTGTLACQNLTASGTATFNAIQNMSVSGTATFNTNITLQASAFGGSRFLFIDAPHSSGLASVQMTARGQMTGALSTDGSTFYMESQTLGKELNFRVVNSSAVTLTPLRIYANGAVNVGNNAVANKILILYEQNATDTPSSATNFFGWGISTGTLRHQVPTTSNTHRFFCGSTLGFTITNTGGTPVSDARFKSELQPIEHALQKISQLQGKTFRIYDNEDREMGFVAQEVLPVVPEVVYIDETDEHRYHSLRYDKLTALLCEGIKELLGKVNVLEAKVAVLEGNPS